MLPCLSFPWHRRPGGVESTCHLVSTPSCGIEDKAVWSPHAAPFPLFPRASKTRLHESTCHLVSPLFWGIEDEAVWSPHTASFPPFPGALKMRWCGAHMPPCFPSSLGHRRRGGMEPTLHLVSLLHHGIEDEAAWSPHAASFLPFTMALRMRQHRTHMPPCFFSFP